MRSFWYIWKLIDFFTYPIFHFSWSSSPTTNAFKYICTHSTFGAREREEEEEKKILLTHVEGVFLDFFFSSLLLYANSNSSCNRVATYSSNSISSLFTYDHRPFRQSCMRRQMPHIRGMGWGGKGSLTKKKRKKTKREIFYFSIDNKEEMFIRSASVQAAHNSVLNIQHIYLYMYAFWNLFSFQHPSPFSFYPNTENLPYLENFQFSTSTNVFSDIILHIL